MERDVLKVQTNQLRFIVRSVSASSISPHLIEPFSSDGVACTDVPGLVHQPLQAEGLGHFHAGHCVPAHPPVNLSSQSNFHNNPPAVHLVGKEKDREPPCLDVWVLQKKLRSHLVHFQLRPTPGLPLSIPMHCNGLHLKQHVQLVLGHHHPQPVAGVNHEDDALVKGIQIEWWW